MFRHAFGRIELRFLRDGKPPTCGVQLIERERRHDPDAFAFAVFQFRKQGNDRVVIIIFRIGCFQFDERLHRADDNRRAAVFKVVQNVFFDEFELVIRQLHLRVVRTHWRRGYRHEEQESGKAGNIFHRNLLKSFCKCFVLCITRRKYALMFCEFRGVKGIYLKDEGGRKSFCYFHIAGTC